MKITDQLILAMSDNHDWEKDINGIKFARKLIELAQEVEPLKFVRTDESPDDFYCQTSIGKYVIFKFDKGYLVGVDGVVVADGICKERLAIEASQQDYARRVLSGLKYGGGE